MYSPYMDIRTAAHIVYGTPQPAEANAAMIAKYGNYSVPRECVCGDKHLDRWTYWQHRLDLEDRS